jgi:hypothetical protein
MKSKSIYLDLTITVTIAIVVTVCVALFTNLPELTPPENTPEPPFFSVGYLTLFPLNNREHIVRIDVLEETRVSYRNETEFPIIPGTPPDVNWVMGTDIMYADVNNNLIQWDTGFNTYMMTVEYDSDYDSYIVVARQNIPNPQRLGMERRADSTFILSHRDTQSYVLRFNPSYMNQPMIMTTDLSIAQVFSLRVQEDPYIKTHKRKR